MYIWIQGSVLNMVMRQGFIMKGTKGELLENVTLRLFNSKRVQAAHEV